MTRAKYPKFMKGKIKPYSDTVKKITFFDYYFETQLLYLEHVEVFPNLQNHLLLIAKSLLISLRLKNVSQLTFDRLRF